MRDLSKDEMTLVGGGWGEDPVPRVKGNNGWGNGEQFAPGGSVDAQPGFTDTATGDSPSNSGASDDGDR